MSFFLRLAWREIIHSRRLSLFFILNLSLGLTGFLTIDAAKRSFEASLDSRSRKLLTADLAISSRRPLTEKENALIASVLGPEPVITRTQEVYSMATFFEGENKNATTRLIEVIGVERGYPLYGELVLSHESRSHHWDGTWIYPELQAQTGAKVGDRMRLGESEFSITATVIRDSGNSFRGFSLAPRAYVPLEKLAGTGLIKKGSTVFYGQLYRFPEAWLDQPERTASRLARELEKKLTDSAVQVTTHRDASQQVSRLLEYLSDYLRLVTLVGLFLAALGAAYLFRSFLARRLNSMAILMSLGLNSAQVSQIYWLQLGLLGVCASLCSVLFASAALPVFPWILRGVVEFSEPPTLQWTSIAFTLLTGTFGSVLLGLPLLTRIRGVRPSVLFQENPLGHLPADGKTKPGRATTALATLPAIVAFYFLSVSYSHSWKVGTLFSAVFFVAALALCALAWMGLASLERIAQKGLALVPRLALRNLSRARVSATACFVALGLGTLILTLIAQIQKNLETEIQKPNVSEVPSLFLFDIQDEQVTPLMSFLRSKNLELKALSPLIRARLETVNGKPFERLSRDQSLRTREEEAESRFRNRGFNLTYRTALSESETIVKGREFSGPYEWKAGAPPAEVSIEKRFAGRLGLKLGDHLRFDVQGVPVEAHVVSFRRVRWTSFQPNFFVQFQGGALEDAPKTFLASIGSLDLATRAHLQRDLAQRFSNISVIDITQLVERLLSIFNQMSWALRAMAALSLAVGFVVLFSVSHHQAQERERETALLKILGARFQDLRRIFALEFGLLALGASLTGAVVSGVAGFLISAVIFDGLWAFDGATPMIAVVSVTLLSVITVWFATRRQLTRKPNLGWNARS